MTKQEQVNHKRIKTPYCGKNRNRKGSKAKTEQKVNRLRPVEDMDIMDKTLTFRFPKVELRERVYFICNKVKCQVCEDSEDLDYPHHTKQGSKKDDRYLINICVSCHDILHRVGFETLKKTREELETIGWENHLEYMEKKNE